MLIGRTQWAAFLESVSPVQGRTDVILSEGAACTDLGWLSLVRQSNCNFSLPQWPPVVDSLRESSAPLPACVQQAFRQHEKSAEVMLLPTIKCACAAIDLQLFLWRYDRSGLPPLGYMA